MLFNLCLACLATLTNTFGEMTLDMKWMIKNYEALTRWSYTIQVITIFTMIPTSKKDVYTKRTITTVTGEKMYKLTHFLRQHSGRHFFTKVLFKLYSVITSSVNCVASIWIISSNNLIR